MSSGVDIEQTLLKLGQDYYNSLLEGSSVDTFKRLKEFVDSLPQKDSKELQECLESAVQGFRSG